MMQKQSQTLDSYKVTCEIDVRFRDTDAMGHVNNAVYLSYLEFARMRYWNAITGITDYRQVPFILGEVQIRYLSPAVAGERLVVGIKPGELRGASFDYQYTIWDKNTKRRVAIATTVQVCYDYKTKKPFRLTGEIRERILEFERSGTAPSDI
ncbi:acyl-CoA thioesterase [Elusimicrobiota bacterium]